VGLLLAVYYASPVKPGPPRIAVLPFTSVNGTIQEAGLAGGVTLGVNYALYAITAKELFVVTTFSPPRELNRVELKRIAQKLNVRYLISGSVAIEGDTVRVDAQRLDAESETGDIVWRHEFDEPAAQAFKLQDDITRWILKGLDIELSTAEWNRIQFLDDTDSLDAWLLAANGVRHLIRVTRNDVSKAKGYYLKALEIDPDYMSARRGLAWVAFLNVRLGWTGNEEVTIREAKNQLGAVLQERPDDGTSKSLQGAILLLEGKHGESIAAGELASTKLPGSATVWAVLAHTLTYVGEHERALAYIDKAMELSPLHPAWYRWTKGRALRMAGEFDRSVAILEQDFNPEKPVLVNLVELAASYWAAGRKQDARRVGRLIRRIKPGFSASEWLEHPRISPDAQDVHTEEFRLLSSAVPQ
jgi:TolB-like protein